MDKIMKCAKCKYTLFRQIDNITFECQKCEYVNTFLTKTKSKEK